MHQAKIAYRITADFHMSSDIVQPRSLTFGTLLSVFSDSSSRTPYATPTAGTERKIFRIEFWVSAIALWTTSMHTEQLTPFAIVLVNDNLTFTQTDSPSCSFSQKIPVQTLRTPFKHYIFNSVDNSLVQIINEL
jgi:hypothetical protein